MVIILAFTSSICGEATHRQHLLQQNDLAAASATTATMTPPRAGRRDGVVAAHGLGYAYAKRAKRAARARSISSWEARGAGSEKYPAVGGRIST